MEKSYEALLEVVLGTPAPPYPELLSDTALPWDGEFWAIENGSAPLLKR
jgi:hypothetical protein